MSSSEIYFDSLVENYQHLIFSLCYKMTQDYFAAEDLTQDTFLSAYQNLSRFDRKQEKAWLCKIASNKCLDYLRRAERRTIPSEESSFSQLPEAHAGPEEQVLETEVRNKLFHDCLSLPETYRDVATDYFYYEKNVNEIAEKQKKNKKTIQTQIYRARELLKKLYKK